MGGGGYEAAGGGAGARHARGAPPCDVRPVEGCAWARRGGKICQRSPPPPLSRGIGREQE